MLAAAGETCTQYLAALARTKLPVCSVPMLSGRPGASVPPLSMVVLDTVPVPPSVAPELTVIPLAAERSPLTKNVPLCTVQASACEKVPDTVQVESPTLLNVEKP